MANKIVCYTCITGGYDQLKQPLVKSPSIDYICFTDQPSQLGNSIWHQVPIPHDLDCLSNVKRQRILKICPHRYLSMYDVSIWIDGSFQITGDLVKFIKQYDLDKTPLYTRVHPSRRCIYDEAETCIKMKKDNADVIRQQIDRYREAGYPKNAGMVETGIMLRKHNIARCKIICNEWATELLNGSCRDQLSFNYVCWTNHFLPGTMANEFNVSSSGMFKLFRHG